MQIGLAFRQWAIDSTNGYPMSISTNLGGTLEYVATGATFRHFQALSNELNTPFILVCPEDSRRPAANFGAGFSNTNVSYFVGLDANESRPQMFLSGDRHITGGAKQANGIVELTTNHVVGWGKNMHNGSGNVGLADGSAQGFTASRLREALNWTGVTTNRLAMP